MEGEEMRKNKNWYDDDEVLRFISSLLPKFPPVIKKDVINAFREFIEKFEKIELIWYEWEPVYREGRSPEEITKDILYPTYKNTPIPISKPLEKRRWKSYSRKNGKNNKSLLRA